jgi:hypothetical protein
MKNKSKQRTNWLRQERDEKGRFLKNKPFDLIDLKSLINEYRPKVQTYTIEQLEHAFLSGLKANNSFYPPSKLWEFYKRDRGLV